MRYLQKELRRHDREPLVVDEQLEFDLSQFPHRLNGLRDLKDVCVEGTIKYDSHSDQVNVQLLIHGTMIVGCAITNEDVPVDFESDAFEIFSFQPTTDEDVIELKTDTLDLKPVIIQNILAEVPLKVVKQGPLEIPQGEGWEFVSTEQQLTQPKPLDPRLAKLKEFKVK